jgi:hypothetical protein
VAVTLPAEHLEHIAADNDLVLDARTLGGTGIANECWLRTCPTWRRSSGTSTPDMMPAASLPG